MLDIIVFCFWQPSSFLPIQFLSFSFLKEYLAKQKLWLIDDVHGTLEIKMNFYYNSCFCVSQVSSTDPFGSRISKSVFCSVFEILIPLSGLIFYLVLQLGAGVARLAWDNEAQSPCRCCPCLTASQLGLKALQFGLLRNVLGPLKWFCTETLKIS